MHCFPCTALMARLRRGGGRPCMLPWPSAAVALLLAACAHSPRAAVPESSAGESGAASPVPFSCRPSAAARTALDHVAGELQAKGMALQATCADDGVWVVRVRVVDGVKASKVVRGPLADGMEVDMGTPAGVPGAVGGAATQGFSPDVLFNREWLRSTMARHQFDNAPTAWWVYTQRGQKTAPHVAETDLAAR